MGRKVKRRRGKPPKKIGKTSQPDQTQLEPSSSKVVRKPEDKPEIKLKPDAKPEIDEKQKTKDIKPILTKKQEEEVKSIYFNVSSPGAFAGPRKVYRALLQDGNVDISQGQVRRWMEQQETYQLHTRARHKFKRRKVLVHSLDEQWDSDLIVLDSLSTDNQNMRYILLCIDVLSKYVWLEPLPNKSGPTMVAAFRRIFAKGRKCRNMRSDQGLEFCGKVVQAFLKRENIHHFVTHNPVKACLAERAIRSIKEKMWRYFTHNETHTYLPVLQDLANSYNNSYHGAIKTTPASVTRDNE